MNNTNQNNQNNQNNKYSNQYFYGGISGICGILLSHPLDTVKTHIQTGNTLSNFKPSLLNFYKGITVPLLGVGIEKAIVFGTYNYALQKSDCIPLSGAIAGLSASIIVSPYERMKILKQSSQSFTIKYIDVINPRFLFKGLSATFTREVPGFAIYFFVYESLKNKYFTRYDKPITCSASFLYGGLSGLTAWIFIYPQDKIKTILQSSTTINYNRLGIKNVMLDIYKNKGVFELCKYFYKGFSFAAGRAILLHSGTFCMMEILNGKDAINSIY